MIKPQISYDDFDKVDIRVGKDESNWIILTTFKEGALGGTIK